MRRGVIPPGRAGLLILVAALVPVVLGKAKPWAKKVGQGLVKLGEKIQEGVEEAVVEAKAAKPAPKAAAKPAEKPVAKPAPPKTAAAKPKPAARKRKAT